MRADERVNEEAKAAHRKMVEKMFAYYNGTGPCPDAEDFLVWVDAQEKRHAFRQQQSQSHISSAPTDPAAI